MLIHDNKTFWGRVKEKVYSNGMTIKTFSEAIGESYKSMTNRITENRIPKKKGLIEKMAKELGCSIEYLMTGAETAQDVNLSPELERLVEGYNFLDKEKKSVLRAVLKALKTQQEEEVHQYKLEKDLY